MTRGILWIVWEGDDSRVNEALVRSTAAARAVHPELKQEVIRLTEGGSLLSKAAMCRLTPFDETLFLDADTVVLDRLDFGFAKAQRHGLACCICECPWARRFGDLKDHGDIVEYNTGVLFFTRDAADVFDEWEDAAGIDSSLMFMGAKGPEKMAHNDQAAFALAIEQTGFNPYVLPLNWNFRHRWQKTVFGPVKVWHDYDPVPESIRRWNESQKQRDAIIQCGRVA